jgi:hypothetical protein
MVNHLNNALMKKDFLLVSFSALLLIFSCTAADGQKVCGSPEKFKQTHRWQDLPGCTDNSDFSNQTGARTLMSRAKGQFRDFFETWEKGDIDHIRSNSGCTAYDFNAQDYWNSDPELVGAKPAYDELRQKVQSYMEWLPTIQDLWQRYFYAMTYIGAAKEGDMTYANEAVVMSKALQKAIAKAQERNVPDDFLMPGNGTIPAQTIGEIKTKIASYLGQANSSFEDAANIDNAKWEPFTKLLTGERLKFFNDTYRGGTNVFGRGGRYLDTPEEFDAASVMCTRTWGRSGILETWRIDCYTFRGDRQIGGPRSRSGYGTNTPPSAYQ